MASHIFGISRFVQGNGGDVGIDGQRIRKRIVHVAAKNSARDQGIPCQRQQPHRVLPTGRDLQILTQSMPFANGIVLVHSHVHVRNFVILQVGDELLLCRIRELVVADCGVKCQQSGWQTDSVSNSIRDSIGFALDNRDV